MFSFVHHIAPPLVEELRHVTAVENQPLLFGAVFRGVALFEGDGRRHGLVENAPIF